MKNHPCPICQASPDRREQLRGGAELCNGCGFAIRFDERGEFVEYATTSKSHPRGVWGDAAEAVAILLLVIACAGCATTEASSRPPAPASPPRWILFQEDLPPELKICVPMAPLASEAQTMACVTLRDLRLQLRGRRRASIGSASALVEWAARRGRT